MEEKEITNKNRILTELPKKGKLIDWKSTVGMNIDLVYNDEVYTVKIIGCKSGKGNSILEVKYNNTVKSINTSNFLKIRIGELLKIKTKDFKIEIGEQIRDLLIIDREYRPVTHAGRTTNWKWYKYKCGKCGWSNGWVEERSLLKGCQGCNCCASRTVVEDINSIWATDRWMCDLGLSEKDAKTHTRGSHDKVFVICPDCGKQKEMKIVDIYIDKSIGCTCCGHGVSYPEKFTMAVLDQLGIEYIFQLTKKNFEWCNKYKYDFCIPLLNTIIEVHGEQHYKESNRGRSLKEEQENDRIKYELALQNGIKEDNYVVIDCRNSDMEWIKNNILNSKLSELYDLSKIDWLKCEEFALRNFEKEICEYWNNKQENETIKDFANHFNLSEITIVKYLKRGTELGWCEYIGNKKRIAMYDSKGNVIREECSTRELIRVLEKEMGIFLDFRAISEVCKGKRKSHKGFVFKYLT